MFIITLLKNIYNEFLHSKNINNELPQLDLRLNPLITINKIKKNFNFLFFLHYFFLLSVIVFVLFIIPISILFKLIFAFLFTLLLLIPLTSQFFANGLPVLSWVFLFFSSSKIPVSWKPPISVKFLPSMETILYGDNLSELLASYKATVLDVLAWFPYGIIHFALPFIVAVLIWLFAPPTSLRSFGFAFGYMNLIGVIIQNLFATAPPWYKILHGLEKANYSMNGSPGGLGRIDDLFGFDMYTTTFTNSPLIFGAFPSLHSACATMDALWLSYLFPKISWVFCIYVFWLWWCTMYLTHHYFMDLVLGSSLAISFFYFVHIVGWVPKKSNGHLSRFSYESLHYHDIFSEDPINNIEVDDAGFIIDDDEYDNSAQQFELDDMELHNFHLDSSPIHNTHNSTGIKNFESNPVPSTRDSGTTLFSNKSTVNSTIDSEVTLFPNEISNKKNTLKFDVREEVPFSRSSQNNGGDETANNSSTNSGDSKFSKYVVKKENDDDDDDDDIIL
ncbi:hypothetical protein B5S30_g5449 [[Candida] boidinii]|nr:hypothetical protein B5S30_g5449 [[Candida] boidinii]